MRSGEGAAVRARADAGGSAEAVAEGGRRAEAGLGADPFDGVVRGLQQVLGLADAGAVQPLERGRPGLFAEDDGDLVTGAGVTSGLDLGLYFLEREAGPRIAHAVEELFAHERRGTVWRDLGPVPAAL